MRNALPVGLLGGAAATLPMTVAMELMHRRLPRRERSPLPPRIITQRMTRKAGVERRLGEPEHQALALVSHFAYGAATGVLYALAKRPVERRLARNDVPPMARAAGQGVAY